MDIKASTHKVEALLLDKNIVINNVFNGVTLEKEDLLELKKINLQLTKGQPYCVMVEAGEMSSITNEARELSASKEFVQSTIAKAIITKSLGQQIVANFYLKVNKPYIKTMLFRDTGKALDWLKNELESHNRNKTTETT